MNEETLKNNVIVPFLRDNGFEVNDLEFETRFTIQLGRGTHRVEPVAGRLDILCRSAGRNLLVVELKAPNETINNRDRRQVLSYARLLEPMAPFVLISNGKDSRLYSTFTGELLDKLPGSNIAHGLDEDIRLRYEALSSFVAYSLDNLVAFARAQREATMKPFEASPTDPIARQLERKYIPGLFVERRSVEAAFARFVVNNDTLFQIIGESGTGKTTLLCHLAATTHQPALFYSGSLLGPLLLEEICRDFGLSFSADLSEIATLRKVSALVRTHNTRLIIFLDAVDEWVARDKVHQLGSLAQICKQFGFKLCVTCKTSHWGDFLVMRGVPTTFSQHLPDSIPVLDEFDEKELAAALDRSTQMLALQPSESSLPPDLHHPFTLRIALEIAHATGGQVVECVDARRTITRFIEQSIAKVSQPNLYRRVVMETARLLLESGVAQVSMDILRKSVGVSILDELPLEVFSAGILYRHIDSIGIENVGFYHGTLRHFVVACWIGQLDRLPSNERQSWLASRLKNAIALDTALYFFRTGDSREQNDTLRAAVQHDCEFSDRVTAKLLTWGGARLKPEALVGIEDVVEQHLVKMFEASRVNETVGAQIIAGVAALGTAIPVEHTLMRMFECVAHRPELDIEMQAWRLAELLRGGSDDDVTRRLIAIARDRHVSGYVRRYAVEGLEGRTIHNRESLFLELIVDPDPNVIWYAKAWYAQLETSALRDELLQLIDANPNTRTMIELCQTLEHSALKDTPDLLLTRSVLVTEPESLGWFYRSLAVMDLRKAIPEMLNHLRADPFSRLAANLFIAFGEMPTPEVVPIVIDLIDNQIERVNAADIDHWIAKAFACSANDADLIHVRRWLNEEPAKAYIAAIIVSNLSNAELRAEALYKIGLGGLGGHGDNAFVMLGIRQTNITPGERDSLYAFADLGSRCAAAALVTVGKTETDLARLCDALKRVIIKQSVGDSWNVDYSQWWDMSQRKAVSRLLDQWLAMELRSSAIPGTIESLLVLAAVAGGPRTLEFIREQRNRLAGVVRVAILDSAEHEMQCLLLAERSPNGL